MQSTITIDERLSQKINLTTNLIYYCVKNKSTSYDAHKYSIYKYDRSDCDNPTPSEWGNEKDEKIVLTFIHLMLAYDTEYSEQGYY